jgi:hypothetical protein
MLAAPHFAVLVGKSAGNRAGADFCCPDSDDAFTMSGQCPARRNVYH